MRRLVLAGIRGTTGAEAIVRHQGGNPLLPLRRVNRTTYFRLHCGLRYADIQTQARQIQHGGRLRDKRANIVYLSRSRQIFQVRQLPDIHSKRFQFRWRENRRNFALRIFLKIQGVLPCIALVNKYPYRIFPRLNSPGLRKCGKVDSRIIAGITKKSRIKIITGPGWVNTNQ